MTYCSEGRKQHNFLRIPFFLRTVEMEPNTTSFVIPHAEIKTKQNPTLMYLNISYLSW